MCVHLSILEKNLYKLHETKTYLFYTHTTQSSVLRQLIGIDIDILTCAMTMTVLA